ncbi:MAG TPA: pyridoxamine 5'-phosphate oxidase family protein [Streptosporangiaceae bacterium]|nr:pyridoxamine 5'-phosphate oxidase family protein [Streptosporangiaceae bacterium]
MTVNQAQDARAGAGPGPSLWTTQPDPGDLSRRLTARRAELRLSVSQVAARSRVDRRYLEYLENFPGHPDAATLRKLAAALCTTPAALQGGGHEASPGVDPKSACWGSVGQLERLSHAECHRLLAPRGIGRIAFTAASGLMVLPVNYIVAGGTIVIRTGVGSVIAGNADGPVSFEADHFDLELGQGWSVLVLGHAHRVEQPGELRRLREEFDLRPWPAGEHDLFVRIVPDQLTGRRIRSQ